MADANVVAVADADADAASAEGMAGRQLQLDAEMVESKERQVGEREAAV